MRRFVAVAAATVVAAVSSAVWTGPAAAAAPQPVKLGAYLDGRQEVPKSPAGKGDPDASGVVLMELHGDGRLCYVLRVRNVSGKIDAAHLHRGRAGKNGPIVAQLALPLSGGSVATCTEVGRKLADRLRHRTSRFYVNVHSTEHPDGAVRGQLHRD